jgi:diguanylate cyclase (GGDEF)-like protein
MARSQGQKVSLDEKQIERLEVRLRHIFMGAVSLSFLIVLLLALLTPQWRLLPAPVRFAFPAILLWSVVVTAYVFYSHYCLSDSLKAALRRKSYVDEVTGVFNYRYLDRRLVEEAERTRRYGGFTALLYLDLDGFKDVNDRYGHQVGNTVLAQLARQMAEQVRCCDVFGRIGGDEFLAVLPQTDRREAYVLGERLRETVENYSLEVDHGQIIDFVRASIGVAAFPVNGETIDNVITAADNAVYDSKELGGNKVTVAGEYVASERTESDIARRRTHGRSDRKA